MILIRGNKIPEKIRGKKSREEIRGRNPWKKIRGKKSGLYSTVQYCTVLYSIAQYFVVVMIKNQKRAAECGLGEARFDFFYAFLHVV